MVIFVVPKIHMDFERLLPLIPDSIIQVHLQTKQSIICIYGDGERRAKISYVKRDKDFLHSLQKL